MRKLIDGLPRILLAVFMCAVSFSLTGCQTLKMPNGPDVSKLSLLPNVPTVSIQVSDTRTKDKIGTVGATQMKVKKEEATNTAQNYLFDFLYRQGANVVMAPQFNFSDTDNIRSAAKATNSRGIVKLELNALKVSSFDVILDPPKYEAEAMFALYNADGKCIFQENIRGEQGSQSVTVGGQGNAVGVAISNALWTLENNAQFKNALKSLQQENSEKPERPVAESQTASGATPSSS